MLSFIDRNKRFGRRSFLRVGGLALGGLSLPTLLATRLAAAGNQAALRDKSVIFLFMHGGPSQTETFDPKMTAPSNVCSATGELQTTIPGITFGGTFPKLAGLADQLTIVRSFATGDGNHDIKPVVGKDSFGASLGSVYSRVAGTNDAATGMPKNVTLYPRAVDDLAGKENLSFGDFASTGELGRAAAPFVPGAGGGFQDDLRLQLPMDRIDDRRGLLTQLDRAKWVLEQSARAKGTEQLRDQAFSIILGGVADAFDLSHEDPKTVDRYDTGRVVRPDNIDRKWNNYNNYVDNAKTLGKLLLLARRLCERGCGFVTVTTNFVWDMHSDVNNAGVGEGMQYMGLPFDHAVSALIEDLTARGLSDKILLVCCGEMGRTPKINAKGGRDHWGDLAPLLLFGGGLQMGQVIGQSDREAARPAGQPVSIANLNASIMHTLFDVGELRLVQGLPSEVIKIAGDAPPIYGLH